MDKEEIHARLREIQADNTATDPRLSKVIRAIKEDLEDESDDS